jgi:PKD repeat protein
VAITVSNQSIVGLVASNSSPTLIGNPTVFTATASGNNIVYTWNFGDSTPVADGNAVTHTYGTFGTFTAVVTATNSGGSVTATTQVTINPVRVFLPFVASNYSSALSALHVGGVLTLTMTDAYF